MAQRDGEPTNGSRGSSNSSSGDGHKGRVREMINYLLMDENGELSEMEEQRFIYLLSDRLHSVVVRGMSRPIAGSSSSNSIDDSKRSDGSRSGSRNGSGSGNSGDADDEHGFHLYSPPRPGQHHREKGRSQSRPTAAAVVAAAAEQFAARPVRDPLAGNPHSCGRPGCIYFEPIKSRHRHSIQRRKDDTYGPRGILRNLHAVRRPPPSRAVNNSDDQVPMAVGDDGVAAQPAATTAAAAAAAAAPTGAAGRSATEEKKSIAAQGPKIHIHGQREPQVQRPPTVAADAAIVPSTPVTGKRKEAPPSTPPEPAKHADRHLSPASVLAAAAEVKEAAGAVLAANSAAGDNSSDPDPTTASLAPQGLPPPPQPFLPGVPPSLNAHSPPPSSVHV